MLANTYINNMVTPYAWKDKQETCQRKMGQLERDRARGRTGTRCSALDNYLHESDSCAITNRKERQESVKNSLFR